MEKPTDKASAGPSPDAVSEAYLKDCLRRLRYCAEEIGNLGAGTEGSFLLIGERLRDFLDRSKKISEDSYSAVSMVSGTEIVLSIEALNSLLRKMEQRVRESEVENNIYVERLKGILSLSDDVMGTMKSFAGTVVDLGTAGTPLKSGGAGPDADGVAVLHDGIEAVTSGIKSSTSHIYGGLSSLRRTLDQTLADIVGRAENKEADYGSVLQDTAESLSTLTEKYGLSTGVASGISERSSEVSSSIYEVVISLQFHDITRQKFEGVGKGLWRLGEAVEAAIDGRSARPKIIEDVYTACAIQIELLDMARDEFVSAVADMKDNLLRISTNISGISEETRSLVCGTAESSRTFLYSIREALSQTSSALKDLSDKAELQKELSLALSSAIGTASEHVKDIEDISGEVRKILGLPVVRKDLIGLESTVLSMVIESARCLSAQTAVLADSVSGLLESLSLFVNELTGSDVPVQGSDNSEIQKSLDGIMSTLRTLNSNVRESLISVDRSSEGLLADIKETAEKINVHNSVNSIVDGLIAELEGVLRGASLIVPSLGSGKYVRPERRRAAERRPDKAAKGAEEGLGDNVEMF